MTTIIVLAVGVSLAVWCAYLERKIREESSFSTRNLVRLAMVEQKTKKLEAKQILLGKGIKGCKTKKK